MTEHDTFPYSGDEDFRPGVNNIPETIGAYPDGPDDDMPLPEEGILGGTQEEIKEEIITIIENGLESLEQNTGALLERGTKVNKSLIAKIKEATPDAQEAARRIAVLDHFQEMTGAIESLRSSLPIVRNRMEELLDTVLTNEPDVMQELSERYRNVFKSYGEQLIEYEKIVEAVERFDTLISS
ncbi:MAG: hypothetical protein HGA67_00835 [Candidatus Yonathbacteria bacterium]|nr:hypothetical protein [Candidatus Yonathbacteria bacterium]